MAVTILDPLRTALGECPVWDEARGLLLLCDIIGNAIHAVDPSSGAVKESHFFPSEVGSFGLTRRGRLVVALRDRVVLYNPKTGRSEPLATPGPEPTTNRFNDGKVGPDGAFWVGSMDDRSPRQPTGALYRLTADGKATRVIEGLTTSNGLAWSADGLTMFHSDSGAVRLDAWDFDPETGVASNRRTIAAKEHGFDATTGRPDGAATDQAGTYWSAGVFGGRLNRFSADGRLLEHMSVPVWGPTMPCFGGEGLRTLFVTSLRHPLGAELVAQWPASGAVLRIEMKVAGVPVGRFAD